MKTILKTLNSFAAFLMVAMLSTLAVPSVYAGGLNLEGASQKGNDFLDGIENAVKDSGIVDLKKKLWEDHKLLIKPYFKTRYDLSSNVFKAPDTDSDHTDSMFTFTPGFQWVWNNAYGVIGGAYEASFRYFTQFNSQNEQDQKTLFYANLNLTDNLILKVSEKLESSSATAGSTAFEPIDFTDNTISVTVQSKMGERWVSEFGYSNFDRDFKDAGADRYSYDEDKFDYRIYYQLTDAIRVYTGIRVGNVDFGKSSFRDENYWELPIGIEGTLPSGINIAASVAPHRRNREADDQNDLTLFTTNLAVNKTFNDKTQVHAGFSRRPVVSSFSTTTAFDEKLWYAGVKHLVNSKLRARGDLYFGNRDFEDRTVVGPVVFAGGAAFIRNPQTVKRDDDVFGITLGADYNVRKWLVLHADYQYSRRNSNISALDYTENALSLRSTIAL